MASPTAPLWTGTARSPAMGGLGAALGLLGLVAWFVGSPATGSPFLIAGVVVGAFSAVEVTIDRDAVRIRSLPLGVPRVALPVAELVDATAIDVRPRQWGGWGYRGSLRAFRRAAWVLRAGPGLELELTGGRRFAVTVDDPAPAAALLRSLRPGG